jgi:CheY-like chemotaxis protein
MGERNVLVVDDDATVLAWAVERLTEAGYQVFQAADGKTAVEMANQVDPHVILLDVVLPGLLGTEVCESLRRDHGLRDVPIVFLCATDAEIREVGAIDEEEYRAEDMLRKPIAETGLLRVVRKWSRTGRGRALPDGAENRKMPRVRTDLKAEVLSGTPDIDPKALGAAQVVSISEGGAFLVLDAPVDEGTVLALSIELSATDGVVTPKAKVLYSRRDPEPGAGVAFVEITQDEKARVQHHIEILRRLIR